MPWTPWCTLYVFLFLRTLSLLPGLAWALDSWRFFYRHLFRQAQDFRDKLIWPSLGRPFDDHWEPQLGSLQSRVIVLHHFYEWYWTLLFYSAPSLLIWLALISRRLSWPQEMDLSLVLAKILALVPGYQGMISLMITLLLMIMPYLVKLVKLWTKLRDDNLFWCHVRLSQYEVYSFFQPKLRQCSLLLVSFVVASRRTKIKVLPGMTPSKYAPKLMNHWRHLGPLGALLSNPDSLVRLQLFMLLVDLWVHQGVLIWSLSILPWTLIFLGLLRFWHFWACRDMNPAGWPGLAPLIYGRCWKNKEEEKTMRSYLWMLRAFSPALCWELRTFLERYEQQEEEKENLR